MKYSRHYNQEIAEIIRAGGVGVGPTDTVYGVLALADNEAAVNRVYSLKNRNPNKPCIILVDNLKALSGYGIEEAYIKKASVYWPAPVTLVLPSDSPPRHLARGGDCLAFRLPEKAALRKLIRNCGSLIAPSANPEGSAPALSVGQAKAYFKGRVDFYVGSNHPTQASASTILRLTDDGVEQLR